MRTIFSPDYFSSWTFLATSHRAVWPIEIENQGTFLKGRVKNAFRPVVFLSFRAITLLVVSKQVPTTKGLVAQGIEDEQCAFTKYYFSKLCCKQSTQDGSETVARRACPVPRDFIRGSKSAA